MAMIPALLAISTAVTALGAVRAGQAQQVQYNAQAQANDYNAAVQRQRAEVTTQAYGQREEQQRRVAHLAEGKRLASAAQSGTGPDSNAALEHQSEVFAELDALNIRYEGDLESKGLLASANLQDYNASANRGYGASALSAGYLSAFGNTLSGAANIAGYGNTGGRGRPNSAGSGGLPIG